MPLLSLVYCTDTAWFFNRFFHSDYKPGIFWPLSLSLILSDLQTDWNMWGISISGKKFGILNYHEQKCGFLMWRICLSSLSQCICFCKPFVLLLAYVCQKVSKNSKWKVRKVKLEAEWQRDFFNCTTKSLVSSNCRFVPLFNKPLSPFCLYLLLALMEKGHRLLLWNGTV